ncbi:MAG: hypothetical protein LBI56_01590 [Puniceicoccales bacterium]|jgi:hypothetical protein|nr:hypothetical protein [Puniceicoccales bacterium]
MSNTSVNKESSRDKSVSQGSNTSTNSHFFANRINPAERNDAEVFAKRNVGSNVPEKNKIKGLGSATKGERVYNRSMKKSPYNTEVNKIIPVFAKSKLPDQGEEAYASGNNK